MSRLIAMTAAAIGIAFLPATGAQPSDGPPSTVAAVPATVAQLMRQDLEADAGREIVMLTVTYAPGGSSAAHRHDAQVFVYVLEGALTMQVQGQPAVTLHPGETFYEAPGDVHAVSANASKVAPARFLVVMVKDKSRPASRPVTP